MKEGENMSVKVVTIGTRGFATLYTRTLLDNLNDGKYEFVGVVDRNIDECVYADEFKANNIPIYKSIENFFKKNTADLVVISTPPQFHEEQSVYCVEHGANVLCEKPIAPDFERATNMIEAQKRTGKFIAIGYQHSYTTAILNLKKDIADGVFGNPVLLKTIVLWPREWSYYNRGSRWAGKIKDENGKLILDSVLSNAAAHFLHNMLYVLGEEHGKAALPKTVEAELLRANDIENFDTSIVRIKTQNDAELFMVSGHPVDDVINPVFEFKFEKAVITYRANEESIIAKFNDGTVKNYGEPLDDTVKVKHLWDCIDAVKSGTKLPCDVTTATSHNIVINSLYENVEIKDFPKDIVIQDIEKERTYVEGLFSILKKSYEEEKFLSELGYDWAEKTSYTVDEKYSL